MLSAGTLSEISVLCRADLEFADVRGTGDCSSSGR